MRSQPPGAVGPCLHASSKPSASGRLLLQVLLPLAERGEAVHPRAVGEGALRRRRHSRACRPRPSAARPAARGRRRRSASRAGCRSCSWRRDARSPPRRTGRRTGRRCPAPRPARRPSAPSRSSRRLPRRRRCFALFLPASTMFGFSTMPSSATLLIVELLERLLQHPLGDLVAAVDVVVAVHQHFRLDDRHDAALPGRARHSARAHGRWCGCRCSSGCPAPMSITARHLAKRAPCS